MRVEAFLAFRYLTRKQRVGFISLITWMSVLGMAVGVMALIVVLSVMSGFDAELKDKIVGMQNHVMVRAAGGLREPDKTIEDIRALGLNQIDSAAPYVEGQAIIRSAHNATGVVVRGLDEGRDALKELRDYLVFGHVALREPVTLGEELLPRILIGQGLAWTLQVTVGDRVDLISPHIEKRGLLPGKASTGTFVVGGVYAFGMNDFDTAMALIDVREAQKLYHLDDRVTGVGLRIRDVDQSETVQLALQAALGPGRVVGTWIDQNRNFFAALKVEKSVMTIILSLIILVAAFNIISSLIMLVMEKTKEIGILRALGLSAGSVRRIFLLEGLFIGISGTALGTALGLFMAKNLNPIADVIERATGLEIFPKDIYYFDKIPAQIQQGDIVIVVAAAFVLAVLASWYPAERASRLMPVEALRYE